MPDPLQVAGRLARKADRASAGFARQLSRVWRDAERQYRSLIASASESTTATIRAVQAAALRRQMREVLTESGYDALVETATDTAFEDIAASLLRQRPDLAALVARPNIEALKQLHALDLLDEGDAVSRKLWDSVARGLFARKPVDDILADVAEVLDRTDAQIATLYDTSVSIFTRQVELLSAGDDPDTRFIYAGPDDDVTRPFCQAHVGQTHTRAEIEALDNGQLDNVLLTGGGYNCRHVWLEVSRFA